MVLRKYSLLILLALWNLKVQPQINAYARVTSITDGSVLALSNVNQTFDSFVAGELVVVIQMKGATITGNTANNSSFGTPNSLNSAGLYEIGIIQNFNAGAPSLTLVNPLSNSYNTAGFVQVISYPQLGTTHFTTTSNITGVAWNGNVGGVIAFYVNGNLNLLHNINANSLGFRGGNEAGQNGDGCETNVFRIATGDARYADKGEGVFEPTNTNQVSGRAKLVNGGGGGIVHNGGGGGGGNFTAGGNGYFGYTGGGYCSATTDAGGQGGLAIGSTATRVFMGGGGGGGQENNNAGSAGGRGGGIILLKADTIVVSGACASVSISANGATASSGGNDGMGGGGAGGSMVLQVGGIRAVSGCPLTISANGGDGGSVGNGSSHGSGGGGGQGALYISASGTFSNTTITANNGAGGSSRTGGSPPTAGSGGGSSGSGVITGTNTSPLPIELIRFAAFEREASTVELQWTTTSEKQNLGFEILYTYNGSDWEPIGFIKGAGNSNVQKHYRFTHYPVNRNMNYYKLKQLDEDGKIQYSPILYVLLNTLQTQAKFYPNPSSGLLHLEIEENGRPLTFKIYNSVGREVSVLYTRPETGRYTFDFSPLPKGLYVISTDRFSEKVIVE